MPAHGQSGLTPEIPCSVVGNLIAQSLQQAAEAAVQFKAQATLSLFHDFLKQILLFQRGRDAPNHVQILVGHGGAVSKMELAQQFVGVAAHIAGADLVGHDLAFGVDDEGAAFCHAVSFNQNFKVLGDSVGGISQHGVADLLDAVGCIVPCLVDEVGVGGDRVDLAAGCHELVIDVGQVFQLGGADEGEVSGVEEEDTPLTQDIRLGYFLEFFV